jgi:hypothetical protein
VAVSKRTRFEVLRRDEHTCQYCGQMAPDVKLQVDHVIPAALGGSDSPDNLIAACVDCNAGKSSISPDSPIVASVAAKSAEYVLAQAVRAAHMSADYHAMSDYEDEFFTAWKKWGYNVDGKRVEMDLPDGWQSSLKTWWRLSVPLSVITSSIDPGMTNTKVAYENKFRYFAGVVWNVIDEYGLRYPAQSNEGRVYSIEEVDDAEMDGWRRGYEQGQERAAKESSDGG